MLYCHLPRPSVPPNCVLLYCPTGRAVLPGPAAQRRSCPLRAPLPRKHGPLLRRQHRLLQVLPGRRPAVQGLCPGGEGRGRGAKRQEGERGEGVIPVVRGLSLAPQPYGPPCSFTPSSASSLSVPPLRLCPPPHAHQPPAPPPPRRSPSRGAAPCCWTCCWCAPCPRARPPQREQRDLSTSRGRI